MEIEAHDRIRLCHVVQEAASIVRDWLERNVWNVLPADVEETAASVRRRRLVTVVVIVLGTVALGASLRIEPGSAWFYPATLVLALIWAVGALASGPLHLGRIARRGRLHRPFASPIFIGLALAAAFIFGAFVVRQVPILDNQVQSVLEHADQGSLTVLVVVTAVGGLSEELFFRGAVYASVPRYPVLVTTAAYSVATLATGNVMLTFAALVLGIVVGLERRASGGILAPALTHVVWSLTMLIVLPLMFA